MSTLSQIPNSPPIPDPDAAEQEAKRSQEEQMRRDLLATILDTAARERLSRIALVSTERSNQVQAILLRMAQSGQLKGRVSEAQLIDLLDQMEEAQGGKVKSSKPTIVYQRRRDFDDDFDI